jgi:hypothetical protein
MGATSSPYQTGQGMGFLKEVTLGDRKDPANVFRWEGVRLNLPTTQGYDPMIPWVSKRRKEGELAADFFTYMDDMRPLAPSDLECWQATSRVSSMCNHLGIQHAARKQRGPSTTPGSWVGSMLFSNQSDGMKVLVTQEKWDKTKRLLAAMTCELAKGVWLNFKYLESARGFMIYVSRTYRPMIPFLLGIHHTLDSWRPNRREDGWRQNRLMMSMEGYEDEAAPNLGQSAVLPPATVKAAKRLADDLRVLTMLTNPEVPPLRRLRGSSKLKVLYGFGDSSGNCFGWSIDFGEEIRYEHGLWSETLCEEHSNYKEL